jgi:hypothetical protein
VVSVDFGREHVAVATAEWLEAHAALSVSAEPGDRVTESR